jgi:NAD(P)-dependent dehydrogenase (short-subunit alcohol dehydrogenase family)
VTLDVTDAARCAEVLDEIRPHVLVNSASHPVRGAIEEVDDAAARLALEAMVVAPARLARLALRHMRARGEGRIVNVSSVAGLVEAPLGGWYQATKHALAALTEALRIEVAPSGVQVILVEPGAVDPVQVAAMVGRALTAASPWARYPVGWDAYVYPLSETVTPSAIKDRVLRLLFDL